MLGPDFWSDLFAGYPPGHLLLDEVRNFYGSSLRLERLGNPSAASHFSIDPGGETRGFRSARIYLNTATSRVKAAAVHELLHLCLPARGFPVLNSFTSTHAIDLALWSRYVPAFVDKTLNVVQHDVFVDEFVAAGLPISEFLGPRTDHREYGKEARQSIGKFLPPDRAWQPWSWWSFEYLNNHISIGHGDDSAKRLAKSTAKWGDRLLSGFSSKALEIETWVTRRRHQCVATYPDSMRELFQILGLPIVLKFCALKPNAGTAPSVVPID